VAGLRCMKVSPDQDAGDRPYSEERTAPTLPGCRRCGHYYAFIQCWQGYTLAGLGCMKVAADREVG